MTPVAENLAPQPKRVSVVIVSLNRRKQVHRSLEALGSAHQIIVVDNGSTDGTLDLEPLFPNARFVRLPRNFGHTKALNLGVRAAEAELVLLLHDDVCITADDVSRLADILESRSDVGAICPLLLTEDGRPGPQVRALPTPDAPDPPLLPATGETAECISGAAVMVRPAFLRAMRYLDESYGNYGSELDLCWQLRHAQKKILIARDVRAIHDQSPSPIAGGMLTGDRASGIATFLGKRHGGLAGTLYRLKTGIGALITVRFSVVGGVWGGTKIDGTR